MRWTVCHLIAGTAALLAGAASASVPRELLPPTPMVLKDGRIARLAAFAVPVPLGAVAPGPGTALALDRLIDTVATDCFLTAQAIGHAEPLPAEADPLAAHRLARDRADHIRARLLHRGLPEGSVASVWDWQQGLRDARVTLWVFRLLQGEDCDGSALPGPRPPAEPPPRLEARRLAMLDGRPPDPPQPTPLEAVVAPPGSAEPAPSPQPAAARAGTPGTPGTLRAPEPAAAPEPVAVTEPVAVPEPLPAAVLAPEPTLAAVTPSGPSEELPPQVVDGEDGLTITFDADSSYLPNVASRELRRLAGRLESGRSYELELEGTVAPDPADIDPAPGQAPYSRWIAERRMSRIEELVRRNSPAAQVSFRQGFVENDASRRVTIRLRALP